MLHGTNKIFIHPGEFSFGGSGLHLHALLGSCISITLWHPEKRIGGMCHFTNPFHLAERSPGEKSNGRSAEGAMALFARAIAKNSTKIEDYQAKIFGGGNMMKSHGENVDDSLGTKNAAAAMEILMREGVSILVAHVGEFGHRRIVFNISTGEVWVKHHLKIEGQCTKNISGRS